MKKQHYIDDQGREWIRFNGKPPMLVSITKLSAEPAKLDIFQHCFKHDKTHYLLEACNTEADADLTRAARNLKQLAKWYLYTVVLPGLNNL